MASSDSSRRTSTPAARKAPAARPRACSHAPAGTRPRRSIPERLAPEQLRLSKQAFFDALGYRPHRGQRRIHQCTRRFIVAVCGRRWGKTLAAAREAGFAALQPGARVYVVAPYQHLCTRVFDRVWRDLITRLRLPTVAKSRSEMRLEFPWDALIEGRTADNPENLVGEGLTYVVFDEAAKARAGVWERYLAPSLMDRRGRALFISTPEGLNWLYPLYLRGRKRGETDWHSFASPSAANPHLPREELLLARRTLSQFACAQELDAQFTRAENLVYPAFSHQRHVQPLAYDPRLPLYRALDFGYTNPFVCLTVQVAPGDCVRVLDEIYLRGRTIAELAELLRESLAPYFQRFREFWWHGGHLRSPRPASRPGARPAPAATALALPTHPLTGAPHFPQTLPQFQEGIVHFCDPAGAGERAHLRSFGILTQARSAPLALGLELIRSALEVPAATASPRLLIDPRCTNLLREFTTYRYPPSASPLTGGEPPPTSGESPLKEDDHALDALRYLMVGLWG